MQQCQWVNLEFQWYDLAHVVQSRNSRGALVTERHRAAGQRGRREPPVRATSLGGRSDSDLSDSFSKKISFPYSALCWCENSNRKDLLRGMTRKVYV